MSHSQSSDQVSFDFQVVIQDNGKPPRDFGIVTFDHQPCLNERILLQRERMILLLLVVVVAIRDNTLFVHTQRHDDIDLDSPTRQSWLNDLKEGDSVVIRHPQGIERKYRHSTVSRVLNREDPTITQIWVDGSPFNTIGVFSRMRVLVEPTPRILNEIARTKLLERMSELNWQRLPVKVLERIVTLVESDSWSSELAEELKLKE